MNKHHLLSVRNLWFRIAAVAIILIAAVEDPSTLRAQASVGYDTLPAHLDGTMSLYDFSAVQPSAIPDSLTPVSISYIARHGARFLSSEKKVTNLEKRLCEARDAGRCSQKGDSLLALLAQVKNITSGRWGLLSAVGVAQEKRLGREMGEIFPNIFRSKDSQICGVASYVPRVIETMDYFTISLAEQFEGISTEGRSGKRYNTLTRFFETDSIFDAWRKHGEWEEAYNRFVAKHISTRPAIALLGEHSGLTDWQLRAFTLDLYGVLQGLRAMGMPAPTSQWMSEEEYDECCKAANLEKYFRYSISSLSTAPALGARPVLEFLLDQQDNLLHNEDAAAGLYGIFGHAETLLPVFALLGIENATALPLDYEDLSDEWQSGFLTPLAANLAIIYSLSPTGRWYASMRLNGRNISPTADPDRLIVPLADLRQYWLHRLHSLTPTPFSIAR